MVWGLEAFLEEVLLGGAVDVVLLGSWRVACQDRRARGCRPPATATWCGAAGGSVGKPVPSLRWSQKRESRGGKCVKRHLPGSRGACARGAPRSCCQRRCRKCPGLSPRRHRASRSPLEGEHHTSYSVPPKVLVTSQPRAAEMARPGGQAWAAVVLASPGSSRAPGQGGCGQVSRSRSSAGTRPPGNLTAN